LLHQRRTLHTPGCRAQPAVLRVCAPDEWSIADETPLSTDEPHCQTLTRMTVSLLVVGRQSANRHHQTTHSCTDPGMANGVQRFNPSYSCMVEAPLQKPAQPGSLVRLMHISHAGHPGLMGDAATSTVTGCGRAAFPLMVLACVRHWTSFLGSSIPKTKIPKPKQKWYT